MLDNDFSLSEGEISDEEGEGILLYLGDSIVNSPVNGKSGSSSAGPKWSLLSDFMNSEEDISEEESSLQQ